MVMVAFLFPNFLNDAHEYQQAESLWQTQWEELVRHVGQEWLWETPWLKTDFANGTPCRDGNPIFSAISRSKGLGVRIIQVEPGDKQRELYVWTNVFAKGDPEEIKELVISCSLTQETLLDAVDLMKRWLTDEEVGFEWDSFGEVVPVARSARPRRKGYRVTTPP